MAVALVVAVAYTSTMGLLKQKKIDLNGLEQSKSSVNAAGDAPK